MATDWEAELVQRLEEAFGDLSGFTLARLKELRANM